MKLEITEYIGDSVHVEEEVSIIQIADFDSALDKMPYTLFENKGDILVGLSAANCDNFTAGADGQILAYDSTTPYGVTHKTPTAIAPISISDFVWSLAAALNHLTDVATGTLNDGNVLTYNAGTGKWIGAPAGAGSYGYHPQTLRSTNGNLTVNTGYSMVISSDFTVNDDDTLTIESDGIMEVI